MVKYSLIGSFIICIFLTACEKIYYYPDKSVDFGRTRYIAHRGGGNSPYQENTYLAVKYGLEHADGVEVDVHISKDRTVWLAHSSKLERCGDLNLRCMQKARDEEIIKLDSCLGDDFTFTRLEDVFMLLQYYPDKYISIDVKGFVPCEVEGLGVLGIMNVVADQVIHLTKKYNLRGRVMVESGVTTFLNYVKRHSDDVDCYLVVLGDFERGMLLSLEAGYEGISFKFKFDEEITADHVKLIHKKGLKIMLWAVDDKQEIMDEAISISPDFIQINDLGLIQPDRNDMDTIQ
ncbi:MAG: glycerophosphodiester phosphodiesterase [Bacteroidales bacterium]|nr:glycerophosphodiester phosphodiesterase [Bacteroidales bacterium]